MMKNNTISLALRKTIQAKHVTFTTDSNDNESMEKLWQRRREGQKNQQQPAIQL